MWLKLNNSTNNNKTMFVCLMVFNATFNNISVISWRSALFKSTILHIMTLSSVWKKEASQTISFKRICRQRNGIFHHIPFLWPIKWVFFSIVDLKENKINNMIIIWFVYDKPCIYKPYCSCGTIYFFFFFIYYYF